MIPYGEKRTGTPETHPPAREALWFEPWAESLTSNRSRRAREEFQDAVLAHGDIVGDDTGPVDQVGNGGGEHGVAAGNFPVLLQDYWKCQPMFLDLGLILFRGAASDHCEANLRMVAMPLL